MRKLEPLFCQLPAQNKFGSMNRLIAGLKNAADTSLLRGCSKRLKPNLFEQPLILYNEPKVYKLKAVNKLAIHKEDLYKMIDHLGNEDKKTAYDFMQFLIERSKKKPESWQKIDKLASDDEPLTKEELEQMQSDAGFISGEDTKGENGLQTNLP